MDQADTTRKEELAALTAMVREFAADNIAPIVADLDETERFPAEIYAQLVSWGCSASPCRKKTVASVVAWPTT